MLRAAVEHDLAGKRVTRVVQHFAQHRLDRQPLRRSQQPAQIGIFSNEELALLQRLRIASLLAAELAVFALQQRHGTQIAAGGIQGVARRQGCHLQRIKHGAGKLAQHGKRVGAGVYHQQNDGEQREENDLGTGRGALLEEWRRIVFHQ